MPTARVAPAPDADGDYDPLQEVTTVNSTAPLPGALELGAYSPAEQWRCVGENGSLLRITHFVVSAIDVIILVEVYIWGWRAAGASWLMVSPILAYLVGTSVIVAGVLVYGPATKLQYIGPLLAIVQLYYLLFPLFLPVSQKPFGSTLLHLVALSAAQFCTTFPCLVATERLSPTSKKLTFWKDVVFSGLVGAVRRLDNATDLEAAFILLEKARNGQCLVRKGMPLCRLTWGLVSAQMMFASVDMLISMITQFGTKTFAESNMKWARIAAAVTSMVAEVGMMSVYAVELSFDRADVADASSGTASHVRSKKEAIAYLALSAVLTFVVFIVNVGASVTVIKVLKEGAATCRASMHGALSRISGAQGTTRVQEATHDNIQLMGAPEARRRSFDSSMGE